MNINVSCEKHNVSMVVVREYTSRGDIEVTVEPCPECIEEAKGKEENECVCGVDKDMEKYGAHHLHDCPAFKKQTP